MGKPEAALCAATPVVQLPPHPPAWTRSSGKQLALNRGGHSVPVSGRRVRLQSRLTTATATVLTAPTLALNPGPRRGGSVHILAAVTNTGLIENLDQGNWGPRRLTPASS
ncbi:hypothetical protein TREES_T100021095 [Tupaia chinensis]|uniref:Uncharacterized protein n=1 Tax=Tupaia chinensis TaxID=246437 RepID=L9JAZ0_TUPCH|nr:hypothetical protein TREES_T100021095 [Tupaia chinensis]